METKHTKGEWTIVESGDRVIDNRNNTIASCAYRASHDEEIANAKLIAETGTVASETGKTPRQLADENKILLEALIEMYKSCNPQRFGVDLLETDLTSVGSVRVPSESAVLKMCNAIKKATE